METIKFDRVLSVSSEIQGHPAKNMLQSEISPNKNWLCEKGSNKAAIILQLERAAVLSSIHIGNAHSAFVEVLVGKAAEGSDQYESLVPVSVFMTPHDSTSGNNQNCTRFFDKTQFTQSAATKAWDRIKVVCTQPFNKHVPFGLCFIRVQGEKEKKETKDKNEEEPAETKGTVLNENRIKEKINDDEIKIGSFFKKRCSEASQSVGDSPQNEKTKKETSGVKPGIGSVEGPKATSSTGTSGKKRPYASEIENDKIKRTTLKLKEKQKVKGNDESKVEKPAANTKRKKVASKPFDKLMEDVVFVLSGFQNPLRGNLRNLAFAMGAKYSPNWEDRCTHLVCACESTPKYNQVKGKGKIVKKEWLERCHADRKRYPWRKFALDTKDAKAPQSEEEIEADENQDQNIPEFSGSKSSPAKRKGKDTTEKENNLKKITYDEDEYNMVTDEDEESKREKIDTSDYPMPYLPNILSSKTFYVSPDLKNKKILERYIIAYDGIITDTLEQSVEFFITEESKAPLHLIKEKASKVVMVKPSWLCEMNSKLMYTSYTPHLVEK